MTRRGRVATVGLLTAGALGYLLHADVSQVVYLVTPAELLAAPVPGKACPPGEVVAPGSVRWEAGSPEFTLTEARGSAPVRHRGAPPDVFAAGRGAIVQGRWRGGGHFGPSQILAKPSGGRRVAADTGRQ